MKILVVSNCYPPHFVGGYELGCRDVVDQLAARGHDVKVLTSVFGTEKGALKDESHVQRVLNITSFQRGEQGGSNRNLLGDCLAFSRTVRHFSPDVVYFWNQMGLCFWLGECSQLLGCRTAFFLSDTSFTSWRTSAFLRRWTQGDSAFQRTLLRLFRNTWLTEGKVVLRHQPCHFASDFLRKHAVKTNVEFAAEGSIVAHWGIELERFHASQDSREHWPPQRLLYAGQLIREKGVHTAVEAVALLSGKPGFGSMSLSIVGGSTQPDYEGELRGLTEHLGIVDKVHFLGKVPRERLAAMYHEHDVLIFPSMWDEPFAITPLEAMASGLPVIGTVTGGSGELFENESNAMVFEAGNANDCARALAQLCSNQELFKAIRQRAFELVATRYTLKHMVDRIENSLLSIVES